MTNGFTLFSLFNLESCHPTLYLLSSLAVRHDFNHWITYSSSKFTSTLSDVVPLFSSTGGFNSFSLVELLSLFLDFDLAEDLWKRASSSLFFDFSLCRDALQRSSGERLSFWNLGLINQSFWVGRGSANKRRRYNVMVEPIQRMIQ